MRSATSPGLLAPPASSGHTCNRLRRDTRRCESARQGDDVPMSLVPRNRPGDKSRTPSLHLHSSPTRPSTRTARSILFPRLAPRPSVTWPTFGAPSSRPPSGHTAATARHFCRKAKLMRGTHAARVRNHTRRFSPYGPATEATFGSPSEVGGFISNLGVLGNRRMLD